MSMMYVVIGSSGEFSSLDVWVAGVYDDKAAAISAAEEQVALDRSRRVVWRAWHTELTARAKTSGLRRTFLSWDDLSDEDAAIKLGLTPPPPMGAHDTDYTVACVPMNKLGRWSYLDPDEMQPDDGQKNTPPPK